MPYTNNIYCTNLSTEDDFRKLNHTRKDELKLREYIINRDSEAIPYGLKCFNPAYSGFMNKNPHLSWIYRAIGSITLLTRYAIDGGMPEARAYAISDAFLQTFNLNMSVEEMTEWYRQALTMFVSLMPALSVPAQFSTLAHSDLYSPIISQSINYCINNANLPLSVKSVSLVVHANPNYLSSLFHKEVGITFGDFIKKLKIETAKEMIKRTKSYDSQLSYKLGFCNQSYFIKTFKEECGLTPMQFLKSIKSDELN